MNEITGATPDKKLCVTVSAVKHTQNEQHGLCHDDDDDDDIGRKLCICK